MAKIKVIAQIRTLQVLPAVLRREKWRRCYGVRGEWCCLAGGWGVAALLTGKKRGKVAIGEEEEECSFSENKRTGWGFIVRRRNGGEARLGVYSSD